MRKLLLIGAVGLFALTGCGGTGKTQQPFDDAHVAGHNTDPALIGSMPDGFNNWARKCDGPNMVYTPFHGDSSYGAISVVPNDPRCTGGTTP